MTKIKHLKMRRAVGAAAKRIEASERERREANAILREAAHKRWRALIDAANKAREEVERLSEPAPPSGRDVAIIREAKEAFPDLRFFEHDDMAPMTCLATGLALMHGDKTYGEPEYGAVLVDAVSLGVPPVTEEE